MPPTIDDVRKATERLKNKRLPGPENIIAQLLKKTVGNNRGYPS